ncbi:MAG: hypothetical protein Q9214_001043, partial [Letrouitia sp. 1 TL-2023]
MDNLDDTLSSEDLRLLEAYRSSLDAVALQGTSHSGPVYVLQHSTVCVMYLLLDVAQRSILKILMDGLCALLLEGCQYLYTGDNESPHPCYDRERLILMRSLVGARLLKSLEATLKSSVLTKASREQLTGLFLVLLGVIIAVSYTVTTSTEEARCELSRILAHHMVVIGERIGLLGYDVEKQRLVENCHNLWNKTGNFEWDYRDSSVIEDMDMDEFTNQSQNRQELGICGDENEIDHQLSDTIDAATTSDKSHQNDPIRNTKPQTAAAPRADFCWLDSYGTNESSSPTAGEMTICILCNGSFLSDEMCPTCFGPLPQIGGYSDATPQCHFTSTSSIPNSQAFPSVAPKSTDLRRSEFTGGRSQISKRHFRSRMPKETITLENKNESSRSSVHLQAPQRKLPIQIQRMTMNLKDTVRKPLKHFKKTPQRSRRESPLVPERLTCALCSRPARVLPNADFEPTSTTRDIVSKLFVPHLYRLARPLKIDSELLDKIIDYHATYPFPSEASTRLNLDALLRAFTLLSGKDSYIFGGEWMAREVLTRKKTESGRRKLLFRSLAVPIETSEEKTQIPEKDGRTDALDDALDVLSCIQPRLSACHAPLPRSDLQLTAARLLDPQADIQSLRIRRDDLNHLCMLLLAFHSAGAVDGSKDEYDHMLEFARVADCMVQSFCIDGDESGIKWEAFDTVIEHTM